MLCSAVYTASERLSLHCLENEEDTAEWSTKKEVSTNGYLCSVSGRTDQGPGCCFFTEGNGVERDIKEQPGGCDKDIWSNWMCTFSSAVIIFPHCFK